jgi:hypothetical protein
MCGIIVNKNNALNLIYNNQTFIILYKLLYESFKNNKYYANTF